MYVLPTLVTIALFTAGFIAVRVRWSSLTPRTRKIYLATLIALFVFSSAGTLPRWEVASDTLVILLQWCRDLSYIFLAILFTRLRPRWLSTSAAIVLIVPIFSASILLPLGDIFNPAQSVAVDLGHNLQSTKRVFYRSIYSSGVDFAVYQRSVRVPMFRHRITGIRFFNSQCDTDNTVATIEATPAPGHILVHCPAWPAHPNDAYPDLTAPLP